MPNEHERQEAIDPTQRQLPNRERVKSDAAEVLGKAKEAGQQHLESGKQAAVTEAEKVAAVIEGASSQFKQHDLQTLADLCKSDRPHNQDLRRGLASSKRRRSVERYTGACSAESDSFPAR
jgi:hypothetical protein